MDDYRPVSLLTVTSKLFEKVVFTQLYEYIDKWFVLLQPIWVS